MVSLSLLQEYSTVKTSKHQHYST